MRHENERRNRPARVALHVLTPVAVALVLAGCRPENGTGPGTLDVLLACPDTVVAGYVFPDPVTASARDGAGAALASSFELEMVDGPAGAVLTGTTSIVEPGGAAEFGDLVVSTGGEYTLEVTADGLASDRCAIFVVSDPAEAGPLLWIEKMDVHELQESLLIIHGMFELGSQPTVTLDGASLSVSHWSDSLIVASLSADPFAGSVTVWSENWPSNSVPLTGWKGEFQYEVTIAAPPGGSGSWQQSAQCSLHLRGDAHPPQAAPGAAIEHRVAPIIGSAPSSGCTFEMTGTICDEDGNCSSLSGSGAAEHVLIARISSETRVLEMLLSLFAEGTATSIGAFPLVAAPDVLIGTCDDPGEAPEDASIEDLPMFALPMDATSPGGLSVEAGSRSVAEVCGSAELSASLSWEVIPAISPYTRD